MLQHREITLRRIENFAEAIRGALYSRRTPVTLTHYAAPDRITFAEAMKGKFTPINLGERLGPNWGTHWFKLAFKVPSSQKKQPWHLLWDSHSEACVWSEKGVPLQAFSDHRQSFAVTAEQLKSGEIIIEMAVNVLFGVVEACEVYKSAQSMIGYLETAQLAVFNEELWALLMDYLIIGEMARNLPESEQRSGDALYCANEICNTLDLSRPETYAPARQLAQAFLSEKASDATHQLSAVGHAHLDLAWLWPIAETQRKNYRTLATALLNMEKYPEYKFVCSQMQLLYWCKEQHPALYKKLQAAAKKGQFIPVGGTWVEPDCNIPCAESFVRQFLYGQRFMQKEFGMKNNIFWNPDVFGYSGQMPQIMRHMGVEFFLTQKLSWSQMNRFPHNTFIWEGIDGSSVLTHFPPADTYNCSANVKEVLYNVANNRSKECSRHSLMLYGFGDGGSGPTQEMIERVRRMKNVEGLPQTTTRAPEDFFALLKESLKTPRKWVGELYLELHRGCQTSQARNKRYNRLCEKLLRQTEMLYACNDTLSYPKDEIDALWRQVMLYQFHDIIPGSSIHEVYDVTAREYPKMLEKLTALRDKALAAFAGKKGKNYMIFNPATNPRWDVVELPGCAAPLQTAADGTPLGYAAVDGLSLNILTDSGAQQFKENAVHPVSIKKVKNTYVIENERVCAIIDTQGHLVSFKARVEEDLEPYEYIEQGACGNDLVLYDDHPNAWDAWDVDVFYSEKRRPAPRVQSMVITEKGPLRARLEITYALTEQSTLTQTITLCADSSRLDFENVCQWHENHTFLKVEFPWNLRSQQATYEIQGGYLKRNTHDNTSWDVAQFEVAAQRWADLSEPDHGIALLNDCKYGYHTSGNRVRLSLLRGPQYPDPQADQGTHTFAYAIFPHEGQIGDACVNIAEEAEVFNNPLCVVPTAKSDPAKSDVYFPSFDMGIEVLAMKKAEDNDDLIVRINEVLGVHQKVEVYTEKFPFTKLYRCDGMENILEEIPADAKVQLHPFEICTLRLAR